MSNSYYFICMDCKDGIHLGKAIKITYPGVETDSYGFGMLGYGGSGLDDLKEWVADGKSVGLLQQFLMLHRGHELRILPDTVEKYESKTSKGIPHRFPLDDSKEECSYESYFSIKIEKPDPEKEADDLPIDLIDRLKKF